MMDAQTPPRKLRTPYHRIQNDLASRRFIFLERYMLVKQANREKTDVIEFTSEPPSVASPTATRQTSSIMCPENACENDCCSTEPLDTSGARKEDGHMPPKKRKLCL